MQNNRFMDFKWLSFMNAGASDHMEGLLYPLLM